jgi:endonuclease/exonuclease/phosphatase family metal-dependent hydrolase
MDGHEVTIMTFNVENLFDNRADTGKNDSTYRALADKQTDGHKSACASIAVKRWREQCLYWDWSDDIVARKLTAVAAAILQVNDGRGADIIALQEVENISILERLRTEYLVDANYLPAVLIEGGDNRGIDVAFLSKLPIAGEAVLHDIKFAPEFADRIGDTRGILEATFTLADGKLLTGFAVHFPAPFHPTAMREAAYFRLNELQAALPEGRMAFAAGDFNTTAKEDRAENMLDRLARPTWAVVHEQGCEECRGTQYYAPDDSWSFLDMILWSPATPRGEKTTWNLRKPSVHIANKAPGQTLADGTPARFELPEGRGISDHWPLVCTIESNINNSL